MHLILTHEQADFDALGAMLGAYRMNESAIPVLPRRLNRNCRAFLALHAADLPFVEADDLPSQAIESITLVDTTALITLKGYSNHTLVRVIDHHASRADLPTRWQVTTEVSGACTTLFVEDLYERGSPIHPLEATLMLLGIYEDTGSLSYASTTPRDARAAAYLLEQGANLQLAARNLNIPLSAEQRQVCDRLLAAAETFDIHHQAVIVSAVEAPDLADEVSAIAHKLRDLLDPAAIFLLVHTSEGIRMVARSTTDQVDVAALAARLGGGGHTRAAAALIRLPSPHAPGPNPLQDVRAAIIQMLPDHVRPAVTVQKIMSRRPRSLSPETSIAEAMRLMQRYGYEGFPVLENEQVIGLLTRRAIDRAIAHQLNLPARSLMEAGNYAVHPSDSLASLREVMTHSGWGQIPVTDPQSGKLIGIVTRTDLLKQLEESPLHSQQHNLARQLEAALPLNRLNLLLNVAAQAQTLHMAVFIVGGFVRDLILGRPSLDFDIVVEGDAIALAHALQQRFGGRVVAHGRFGTAKWTTAEIEPRPQEHSPTDQPETLDLISARMEFYDFPTALPTVEHSSIKLDLHRRDFSINTLAMRLDGHAFGDIHDYWGGMRDLREGIVRVLHSLSFVDDPTRQLRAVRFEQRFGFKIETRTLQLMHEGLGLIHQLSGDRVRHELNLILAEPLAIAMLERLFELGLLQAIHPQLPKPTEPLQHLLKAALTRSIPAEWGLDVITCSLPTPTAIAYLVWLLPLPLDQAMAISARLHLPGGLQTALSAAWALQPERGSLPSLSLGQIVQRLDGIPLCGLYAVWLSSEGSPAAEVLLRYARDLRHIWPQTTGKTLQAHGLPPGPIYKTILTELRSAWLTGKISTPAEETLLLEELIHRYG